jgi:hypothetical protein
VDSAYGAFGRVKRCGCHAKSGDNCFAPSVKTYIRRTHILSGLVNRPYPDASCLGRWHHVLGEKGASSVPEQVGRREIWNSTGRATNHMYPPTR